VRQEGVEIPAPSAGRRPDPGQSRPKVRISGKSRSEFPEPTLLIALHLSLVIAVRLLRECIGLVVAGFDAREAGVFPQAAMRQA
jgi:hypothetical protein